MKRIFLMILAVFALGTLSLQAQYGPGWHRGPLPQPQAPVAKTRPTPTLKLLSQGVQTRAHAYLPAGAGPGNYTPNPTNNFITQTDNGVISEYWTPEIAALAQNLENDPKRIFDYVHNYVRYSHYFGSKKGALLTLLEGSGNDFDQCALLVALLRASTNNTGVANYSISYQLGLMQMAYQDPSGVDLKHWLGLRLDVLPSISSPTNYAAYSNLMVNLNTNADYPVFKDSCLIAPQDQNSFVFQRLWVKFVQAGTNINYLDPAFKSSTYTSGIDIPTAIQFNASTLLSQAASGAVISNDFVKSLNWANISNTLSGYTSNLLTDLQTTHTNYTVEQVLSGYKVVETDTLNFPQLPFAPISSVLG